MTTQAARAEVAAIAAHLGDGWTATPAPHISDKVTIVTGPGMSLRFEVGGAHARISGYWPEHLRRHRGPLETSIGVTTTRGPRLVAGDITRRLIPKHRAELVVAEERRSRFEALEAARGELMRRLSETLALYTPAGVTDRGKFTAGRYGDPITIAIEVPHDPARWPITIDIVATAEALPHLADALADCTALHPHRGRS